YLKVWEKIETIETGLNLKAWVLTLAKNKCLDHVRREKIRRSFLVDLIARKQNKMNVSQNTPEKDLALREEQIRLKRTVLDLPEKLKQVIVLREYGECSCQQIATILNIKLGTVHSRLNRAKIRIQKNVEEDNEKQN
ncbi:MAG: RNA polymerase sigma factor, partial [Candidatus Aminicenantes bacterium]|nr:RNA polymerase sigma factor [Candidatus Aminicenantes bacterium]